MQFASFMFYISKRACNDFVETQIVAVEHALTIHHTNLKIDAVVSQPN